MNLLRPLLLWLAGKPAIGNAIERAPYAGRLINRFIAGSNAQAAVAAACSLVDRGYSVTFSYLGEDVATEAETASAVAEYETLIHLVAAAAIGEQTKVAIKPSLIGPAARCRPRRAQLRTSCGGRGGNRGPRGTRHRALERGRPHTRALPCRRPTTREPRHGAASLSPSHTQRPPHAPGGSERSGAARQRRLR